MWKTNYFRSIQLVVFSNWIIYIVTVLKVFIMLPINKNWICLINLVSMHPPEWDYQSIELRFFFSLLNLQIPLDFVVLVLLRTRSTGMIKIEGKAFRSLKFANVWNLTRKRLHKLLSLISISKFRYINFSISV